MHEVELRTKANLIDNGRGAGKAVLLYRRPLGRALPGIFPGVLPSKPFGARQFTVTVDRYTKQISYRDAAGGLESYPGKLDFCGAQPLRFAGLRRN